MLLKCPNCQFVLAIPPREATEGRKVRCAQCEAPFYLDPLDRLLTPDALARLARYPWPGNIRELRNCMESLTLTSPRLEIDVADLPGNVREVAATPEIRLAVGTRMEDAEREIIRRTVEAYPTLKEAARVLGIGLRTLHTKMGRYEIRRTAGARAAGPAAKPRA